MGYVSTLENEPFAYASIAHGHYLNRATFAASVIRSILHSLIIFNFANATLLNIDMAPDGVTQVDDATQLTPRAQDERMGDLSLQRPPIRRW